jgi:hypothetical protein
MSSPAQRTLQLLRAEGFDAAVVERRLPRCFIAVDLFNAFDIVAVRRDLPGVLGAQCTSASNHAHRVRKLLGNPTLRTWLAAGNRAEVISWRKAGGRWRCRRQLLAFADLGAVV